MSATKQKHCPTCKKPVSWEGNPYRPFCSKRCKIIDLGDWAAGRFRIPGEKMTEENVAETTPENERDDTTHK